LFGPWAERRKIIALKKQKRELDLERKRELARLEHENEKHPCGECNQHVPEWFLGPWQEPRREYGLSFRICRVCSGNARRYPKPYEDRDLFARELEREM
jgi:hypothetical protein